MILKSNFSKSLLLLVLLSLEATLVFTQTTAGVLKKTVQTATSWKTWYYIFLVAGILLLISCCWLWYNKRLDPMDWCRAAMPVVAEAGAEAKKGISASAKKVGQATNNTLNATADTLDSTTRNTDIPKNQYAREELSKVVSNNDKTILTTTNLKLTIDLNADGSVVNNNKNDVSSPTISNDARMNVPMRDEVSNRFESFVERVLASRPVFLRRLQSLLEGQIRKAKWRNAMRMAPSDRKTSSFVLSSVNVQQQPVGDPLSKSYSEDSRITFTEEDEISTRAESYTDDKTSSNQTDVESYKLMDGGEISTDFEKSLSNSSYTSGGRKKAAPMVRYTTLESDSSFLGVRVLTLNDIEGQQHQPLVSKSSLDKLVEDWRQYRLMASEMGEIKADQNVTNLNALNASPESTPVLELPANIGDDTISSDVLKPLKTTTDNVYSATGDMMLL